MPKVKSKGSSDTTNEDGSGMTTRSNSVDADADQSNGVTDDISQVNNNPSANMPISQPSSLGYGQQHPSTLIHTVVSRPVYDGKIEHFPSWEMQLEAHLHERKMTKLLTEDNPDPVDNKDLFCELVRCLGFKNAHVIEVYKPDGKASLLRHKEPLSRWPTSWENGYFTRVSQSKDVK